KLGAFMGIRYLLLISIIFNSLLSYVHAENFNLVKNPGFEDLAPGWCPTEPEQLVYENVPFWEGTDSEIRWGDCFYGTNNFFPAPEVGGAAYQCEQENSANIENNAYAGFWTFISLGLLDQWVGVHRAEYLGGELKDSLRPNITYDITYDIAQGRWSPDPLDSGTTTVTRLKSIGVKFLDQPYSNDTGVNNNFLNYHYDPPAQMPNNDFYFPSVLMDQASGTQLNTPSATPSSDGHLATSDSYNDDQENPWLGFENGAPVFDKWYTIKGTYQSSSSSTKKNILIGNFHDLNSDPLNDGDQNKIFKHFRPLYGDASVRSILAYYFIDNIKISCTPEVGITHPDGGEFVETLSCNQTEEFVGELISNVDNSSSGYQWQIKIHQANTFCNPETLYTFNQSYGTQVDFIGLLTNQSGQDSLGNNITLPLEVGANEFISMNFQGRCHVSNTFQSPFYGEKKSFKVKQSETDLTVVPDEPALFCGDKVDYIGTVIDGNEHRWQAYTNGTQSIGPWSWGESSGGSFNTNLEEVVNFSPSEVKLVEGSQLTVGFQGRCDSTVIRNEFNGDQKTHELKPPKVNLFGPTGDVSCREFSDATYLSEVFDDPNGMANKSWGVKVTFNDGEVYTNTWINNNQTELTVDEVLSGVPNGKEMNGAIIEMSYGAICQDPDAPIHSEAHQQFLSATVSNETAEIQVAARRSQFSFSDGNYKVTDIGNEVNFNLSGGENFDDITWTVYGPMNNPGDTNAPEIFSGVGSNGSTFNYTFDQLGYYRIVAGGSSQLGAGNCNNENEVIVLALPPFYFPNAFAPNGNGANEKTGIGVDQAILPLIKSIKYSIFARWGEQMFYSDDFSNLMLNASGSASGGWDGQFKGQPMNPGVFVYMAEIELHGFNQTLTAKGDITLLR
ncbi:gliding motility-associated C-terminal domain-containing protein, partial [Bacteriovoracaceae bacterium]|nr:gliding motility-associated C-terminal domain-containing protein [Bacteriovoracaceae bacterium]